jgi:hypothetical protein
VRTSMIGIVLVASCAWLAAQPPSESKIVIQPRRGADTLERDFPGFIIIRPNAKPERPAVPATAIPTNPSVATQPDPAPVEKKNAKAVFDYWFVAAVEGERIGYLQWTATESEKDGKKFLIGVKHQRFTVDRFGQIVTQFGEESTVETPQGEVLVTSMRQGLGKDQALALSGVVEGKTLKVTGEGGAKAASNNVPWPGGVTGVVREPELFRESKLKPGETFEYLTYVGQVNRVIKVTVIFEAEESTSLWANTAPRKLRRYVSKMEPLEKFKLPAATTWVDVESGEPLRVEFDFPGLGGRVTFLRTTKDAATAPVTNPVKLFKAQSIPLNREIPAIHGKASVVYQVRLPRDDEPGTAFPSDARQSIKNLDEKAKSLELHVRALRGPQAGAKGEPAPGKEYLGSNFFINWDNAPVKGHALKSVAGLPAAATDWDKAKAVELWVNRNMQAVEFSQAMATADNVAKTLSGDCTEYAMLAAAMCRAVGVPSRTVLGLVYAPGPGGKPYLAYHMWFEAYAQGQWLPLDATLGQGGIGPGHVKIAEHSWHEERTFAPLLPVLRVLMAKPTFDVIRVSP